jgi:hypothetical protein
MAVRVVDPLEVVDIQHKKGERESVPVGFCKFCGVHAVEIPAVPSPGEKIGEGCLFQGLLPRLLSPKPHIQGDPGDGRHDRRGPDEEGVGVVGELQVGVDPSEGVRQGHDDQVVEEVHSDGEALKDEQPHHLEERESTEPVGLPPRMRVRMPKKAPNQTRVVAKAATTCSRRLEEKCRAAG